jgi:proteasome lid subunit RPN8/RPN11
MKITIHAVNDRANDELPRAYDEGELFNGPVRLSDNFALAVNSHKVILQQQAVEEIFEFIEWRKGLRVDLRVEQGGILIGKRYLDSRSGVHFSVVSKAITANNAVGTTGFLEISQECWKEMHDELDAYREETSENVIIIGWFHTHPNMLSCFMSGTDRATQDAFFSSELAYSIVINPQRHLIKAYRSCECLPAQAILVLGPQANS